MTSAENKHQSHVLRSISPNIHPTASTLSTIQRKRGLCTTGSSTIGTESASAVSSVSSLMSANLATAEHSIQEQCMSISHRPFLMASDSIQPGNGSRHYVNLCQGHLTPQPLHTQICPVQKCVSDSEISTSSLVSVSALSESSEIRALFPNVHERNQQSPATADHYNQLKVAPSSKLSERARQILYRPRHFESDSSLAESSDSLNMPDYKQREREHYNKLKLNLDSISGNKRAIMGLKVLYRDPPRGYRHLPIAPSPSRSLIQQRQSSGIFYQKTDTAMPKTRYWSEGHSNKIHSVQPDPVRSKFLNWKQEESRMNPHYVLDTASTRPHSQVAPIYRTRSLSETQSYDVIMKDKDLKRGKGMSSRSVDNLSYISTGHTQDTAHPSHSSSEQSQHHSLSPRKRTFTAPGMVGRRRTASNKSFSGSEKRRRDADGMSDVDQDRASGSINFTMSPIVLKYDGEEFGYHSDEHNFTVTIPKGALKKKGTVEVQIGLAIHGPFTFPERSQNVSPILWLCSIPETKFRKPVQIELPHCICTDAYPGSQKRRKADSGLTLRFASANLKSGSSNKSGKRNFEFNFTEGEEVLSGMYGTLLTKHLSPMCVVASSGKISELPREIALHASYCIIPVLPVAVRGRTWNIHFCITYSLHCCIMSLRSYFNVSEFQLMPPYQFNFARPLLTSDGEEWAGEVMTWEPELEIRFPRELPESGWKLVLDSDGKMASSSITFSPCHQSHHPHTLSSSTSSRSSPPPMFTVVVDGTRADRSAVTCVSFVGSVEPVTVKVTLPLNDSETETQLL